MKYDTDIERERAMWEDKGDKAVYGSLKGGYGGNGGYGECVKWRQCEVVKRKRLAEESLS